MSIAELPITQQPASSIARRAVFLSLRIRLFGDRRKVSTNRVSVDADARMISVSKKLFRSPAYDAVKSIGGELRRYLSRKALPGDFVRPGMFLLPLNLIQPICEEIDRCSLSFNSRVDQFIASYEQIQQEAQSSLGSLYRAMDYPSSDTVRQQFGIERKLMAISVPGVLSEVRQSLFEEERERSRREWQEASEEIRSLLRESFRDLVAHMSERLEPPADGQRKVFRNSLVSNLEEFLNDFPLRNITDDQQLSELVTEAQNLLSGISSERLRRGPSWLRNDVQQQMAGIKERLDSMLTDEPTRAITLDD